MRINVDSTSPTLLLNPNPRRKRLTIQMLSTNVNAGNTGRVHIEFGKQPGSTVPSSNQGQILTQGASIDEPQVISGLDAKYKDSVWALASIDDQEIDIEEEIETVSPPAL